MATDAIDLAGHGRTRRSAGFAQARAGSGGPAHGGVLPARTRRTSLGTEVPANRPSVQRPAPPRRVAGQRPHPTGPGRMETEVYRQPPVAITNCPPGSAAGGYRMGRWARLAMTLVVTAALVVGTLTLLAGGGGDPTRLITVGPGETLLSVALREVPGTDPAWAVARIRELNELDGRSVPVGVVLRIPAR